MRQEPGLLTGVDGCATWGGLASGHTYAVEEDLPEGWTALTPIRHEFGSVAPGEPQQFTFLNTQESASHAVFLPLVLR